MKNLFFFLIGLIADMYINERKTSTDRERKVNQNLKKNNKLFQKEVNKSRGEVCVRRVRISDKSGKMLVTNDGVC